MADNEGLRTTEEAIVVSMTPDVCLTPPGNVPVPYQIIGRFSDGVRYADTVRMAGLHVMTMDSRLDKVYGDEAGTGGGITSGVNKGWCRPITHSSNVRAKGHHITYHTSLYWMNCAGADGPGNTQGRVVFGEDVSAVHIGPLGSIEGETNPPAEPETDKEKSWWETGLEWTHTALDVVGMIPVVGEVADGINAGIYAVEAGVYAATGNNAKAIESGAMAALSAAAMIPVGGQAATAAKWGIKGAKELAEEGGERVVKEIVEEGTEKALKEGTEEALEKGSKEAVEDGVKVEKKGKDAVENGVKAADGTSPYAHLKDPEDVGPGKDFTAEQKQNIIDENMRRNGGVVRSDMPPHQILSKPSKSKKGVTPDPNEWQIDHITAKSNGGTNSYGNAQVLSRQQNRAKWDD